MEKLREQYEKEVVPAMMKKFNYKSIMEVPKLDKIVINIGLGDIKDNPKSLDNAMNDLAIITGQKPIVTKARKSIAAFKLREGVNVGCKVTLRRGKMYDFAYKLFNVAMPRIRDFRGISANSFPNFFFLLSYKKPLPYILSGSLPYSSGYHRERFLFRKIS